LPRLIILEKFFDFYYSLVKSIFSYKILNCVFKFKALRIILSAFIINENKNMVLPNECCLQLSHLGVHAVKLSLPSFILSRGSVLCLIFPKVF
jgi:hypothetical protein